MASQATGTLGATISVSATPLVDVYASAAMISQFQALTYVAIGLVENLGEFGRQFELVTFVSISDARTLKLKGPYNDGQLQMTVAYDLSDAGQTVLSGAVNTVDQNTYPFKVVFVGASTYFDHIYFGGKIMSYRIQAGAANSVLRALVAIEVNTQVFVGGT